ncbi:MAG: hypothetical protein RLZZ303_2093 [Candidatus Hydrogenedentota bacterium]|jgi:hypothetical protein
MRASSKPREEPPYVSLLLFRLLWAAGSDLALAATFLITWVWPYTFGEFTVHKLTFLMLVEFLVVHSTGFFAAINAPGNSRLYRGSMFALLLSLYLLFAAAFSAGYGGWWPMLAFLLTALPKAPGILLRPEDDAGQMTLMAQWAAMVVLYLGTIFVALMGDMPPLGITPEVIASQNFTVGGEFPEKPYIVMAFGAMYFTGQAIAFTLFELAAFRRERRRSA